MRTNKLLAILFLICFVIIFAIAYFYNRFTFYDRQFNGKSYDVNIASEQASVRVNETIDSFEKTLDLSEIPALTTGESKYVNDLCLVDRTITNTNIFSHLRSKIVGESMRCVYEEVKYYYWDKSAPEFVEDIKNNQEKFKFIDSYPYEELAERGVTFSLLETQYDRNPAIQVRFAKPDAVSYTFTDTASNYNEVIYQGRFKNIWEKQKQVSSLPSTTDLLKYQNDSQYLIQVSFIDRYFTFYDNHKY